MNEPSQFGAERADLRVALLTNCLSPHTLPLCDAMNTRVREFRAFLSADRDSFHHFGKVQAAFPVTYQRSFNALHYKRRDYGFWASNQLHIPFDTLAQLRKYQPDAVLSCQFGIRTLLSTFYRLSHPTARLFLWANVSTHTEQKRAWYRRILRRWLLRHVDGVFVNGMEGEEYLRSLNFTGPISSLPYTIDETLFRRKKEYFPANDSLRLLYCGRLDPAKGVRLFSERLDAWCGAHPRAKIHFEIIGDGSEALTLQSLRTSPNLTLSVESRMQQNQLAGRYHQADLFVLPSFGDEWAVVVNEAMLAGLPVLGSIYSQAVTEIVLDGSCGWHFDPKSEPGTHAALDRALNSATETLRIMSANAIRRMESFSPDRVATRTVHLMHTIARRPAGASAEDTPESVSLTPKPLI